MYKVLFRLMLNDPGGRKQLGHFSIEVPERSLHDAKKRIREFIKNKLDIEILDFEQEEKE